MTMNGAVLPILALFIVAGEEQGVPASKLAGTIQNDILKEFMVRNTYIYPPAPSMRIVSDIFAYTSANMPKFNSISISGYHMQEAGATADLELGYTIADGIEYARAGVDGGLDIDKFAPRLSFFWAIGMNYFMEIAKMRAARLLWATLIKREFTPEGCALAVAAHAFADLGLELDRAGHLQQRDAHRASRPWRRRRGIRSRCTPTASTKPSRFRPTSPARIARNTQLVLQQESGTTRPIDPWGGSHFIERLTYELALKAMKHIDEVEKLGGMAKAIAAGIPKIRIEEAAARTQARIDSGRQTIVGINKLRTTDDLQDQPSEGRQPLGARAAGRQAQAVCAAERNEADVQAALNALTEGATRQREPARPRRQGRARNGDGRRNFGCVGKGVHAPPRGGAHLSRASTDQRRAP